MGKNILQRDVRKYDEAPEWQLPEPGAFASAKSFRDKVVMPFVNKLKTLIKNLTIQCVRPVSYTHINSILRRRGIINNFYLSLQKH